MTEAQRIEALAPPRGPVDAVLDTDAFNEIDDQFAISLFMLCPERINPVGITAAPFSNVRSSGDPAVGMEKSFEEIKKVLGLIKKEVPVFRGSRGYLPDEKTPVKSEAADFLAGLCRNYSSQKPLYVLAIGAITNVASAILSEPSFRENCVVVWLGGNDINWKDNREFNCFQDVAAARVVFDSGVPLIHLPCSGVVDRFLTTKYELLHWLSGKNALCDYLLDATLEHCDTPENASKPWSKVIWDVTAVAWLLNDGERFISGRLIPSPRPQYDDAWSFPSPRHFIFTAQRIKRDALFAFLFEKLSGA